MFILDLLIIQYICNTKVIQSGTDSFCNFHLCIYLGITSINNFFYLFSPMKNKPTVPGPA